MTHRHHHYSIYIVAGRSHTLYCGVTNSLLRRIQKHREGKFAGFSATYKCSRLVWFENFQYIDNAIHREKAIKGWRRSRKIALIEAHNPTWADLSEAWDETPQVLRYAQDDKEK